jgi:hypothetical protein
MDSISSRLKSSPSRGAPVGGESGCGGVPAERVYQPYQREHGENFSPPLSLDLAYLL